MDCYFCFALLNAIAAMELFKNSLVTVWFLLACATGLTWWLGSTQDSVNDLPKLIENDLTLAFIILFIALVKIRFIIWHFMEVREGPAWLRWTCDFWLAFLAVTLLLLYRYSL